jgi:hypothetical protein
MFLSLCQELVSSARSYDSRAAHHGNVAKSLMQQIENQAQLPKTEATIANMDRLFTQYDEHRAMQTKFNELYKKATEEAQNCMKSVE